MSTTNPKMIALNPSLRIFTPTLDEIQIQVNITFTYSKPYTEREPEEDALIIKRCEDAAAAEINRLLGPLLGELCEPLEVIESEIMTDESVTATFTTAVKQPTLPT